ncbi:MAG: COR domain-containing protein [Bacteroidota bacterium]|nr:COR domain-containing protein [Bacteroidota bacterium]
MRSLGLGSNRINSFSTIQQLTKLRSLQLIENKITDLSFLNGLNELVELTLENNNIKDISVLKNKKRLHLLTLSENPIEKLPQWITDFDMNIKWDQYSYSNGNIIFFNNPITNPPIEIIKQGKKAIKAWFEGEKIFINEVKVLLVGHGNVGKTTLVRCLTGESPNPSEQPTHYIKIKNHNVQHNKKNIKLNFWDFGGQEVMHSTHQFFLSKRSIYLLVLDGRRDEDAEYWLKHIESFGGNSPVLIVLNKIDTNPSYDVDRLFLKKKYPFIVGFYKTTCLNKITGINELQDGLLNALDKVEILTTPWLKNWLPIKQKLEEMTNDFISQKDYESICEKNNVKEIISKETLAGYLNDLGVVVHFKDLRLSDLHILQPRWVSRAAYKIINSKKVAENHGLLKIDWLSQIMSKEDENDFTYQSSVYPYILDLMQKFELCFPISEGTQYLIPELMDIQQPVLPKLDGSLLKFYIKFEDILPRSILLRFIVRVHEDIKDNLRWRTGVVLEVPIFNSIAVIIADIKEKKINIIVSGPRRREHFAIIRKTFHSLIKDFEKLTFSEWIPLTGYEDYALDYDELIGYEESGKDEYFVGKLKKSYKVKDLLNGIESESIRKSEYQWDVFICHSSQDKGILKKVTDDFKKKGITYWIDEEQINPGDNIIDKITDGLQKSRSILPCISSNQLKSGWSRYEYQSILSRIISGTAKQKIIPFILDNTLDEGIPLLLNNLRAERYLIKTQYKRLLLFLLKLKEQKLNFLNENKYST